jgi:hypothetical protein
MHNSLQNVDFKQFAKSKNTRRLILILVVVALMLLSFQVGAETGRRQVEFSGRMGDNYARMFEMHRGGPTDFGRGMMSRGIPGGYGATGKVVSVAANSIVVAGLDDTEKIVHVNSGTMIRELQNDATTSDIKVSDSVIVIGTPNTNGEIDARLIRILPAPASQ